MGVRVEVCPGMSMGVGVEVCPGMSMGVCPWV